MPQGFVLVTVHAKRGKDGMKAAGVLQPTRARIGTYLSGYVQTRRFSN
jgi:hypothetical protein